jgi:hypothetical protein
MKKAICLFLLAMSSAVALQAQRVDLKEDYKSKSNAEVVAGMKELISEIDRFEKMFDGFAITKGEAVAKENIVAPFLLDTALAPSQLQEALNADIRLFQTPQKTGASVVLDKHYSSLETEGPTYTLSITPRKIYFFDGSTTSDQVADLQMDFSFGRDWPYKKRIDSVQCDIKLSYITGVDKLVLTTANPKGNYKGLPLELKKTDKNLIEFCYDSSLDVFKTEPLNLAGKTLNDNASNTFDYDKDNPDFVQDAKNGLNALVVAAEKDVSMPSDKFQAIYIPKIQELADKIAGGHKLVYKKMLCDGNVKGVRIDIANGRKELTASRMIYAGDHDDIHFEPGDSVSNLYNNSGEVVFSTPIKLSKIGGPFYEADQTYYYFNPKAKKLEKLSYYAMENLAYGYVAVEEQKDSEGALLLNSENKNVGHFKKIAINDGVIVAYKDKGYLLVSADGHQKELTGVEWLSSFNNGYAAVKINSKYGFIDAAGKEIILAVYEEALPFSDMTTYTKDDLLFAVKKNGKWGFVDRDNKDVIPFEYSEVEPFSYGVTLVQKEGNRGLITTKNKALTSFTGGSSYGLSTNFGKRVYSIGSGNYNHLGRKVNQGR